MQEKRKRRRKFRGYLLQIEWSSSINGARRWQRRNLMSRASSFVDGRGGICLSQLQASSMAGARQWLEELIGSSIVNGCAEEERARSEF
ncbi:hypothetical protein TorRG33x02_287410 [Trema orientale]|uniref:Uncharacterized protein n=1 Tax=Trema orientale TaxID=63057 RepID=A0A2P5CF42_TREOI|nr:hypothetical protein TorRG33x02_287410 [Trema orientale]